MQPRAVPGDASDRMRRQAERNTGPELALRSELHRRGLRYFVHRRPLPELRREADIVFSRARVAVFVDGCFWHGCPTHRTEPKRNAEFWKRKIDKNQERDTDTDVQLTMNGWIPVRIWEHEPPAQAADRIEAAVRSRSS